MSNVFILKSQQAAWKAYGRPLVESEPGSFNNSTLVLNNSSGASVSLTGLEIIGQGVGNTHDVLNRGTDPIQLLANNAETVGAFQFADAGTIAPDTSVRIYYNGAKWELLSGGGGTSSGGGSIGSDLGGSTPGSVLFATSDSKLGQDNPAFFWDDLKNRLSLVDKTYAGWDNVDASIASETTRTLTGSYAGFLLDNHVFGNGVGSYFFGLYNNLQIGGPGITHANIYGNLIAVANRATGGTYIGGTDIIEGLDVYCNIEMPTLEGYGINLFASTGSGDAAGTGKISGIWSTAGGHIGSCTLCNAGEFRIFNNDGALLTTANILKGVVTTVTSSPITNLRGLAFEGWTFNGPVTNTSVIYADASTNVGTNRHFIESYCTSPSLFSGPVLGVINPYNATSWDGSAKFTTEDAVRDQIVAVNARIDSLVLSSGVDTVSNQDVGGVKNFTSGIRSTSYGAPATTGPGDGYQFSAFATNANTAGEGGYFSLHAGNGVGSGHQGGYVEIFAGDGDYGNHINLYAGGASGPAGRFGGSIILQAGRAASNLAADQGTIQFQEYVNGLTNRTVTWDFRTNTGNRTITIPDKTGKLQVNTQTILKITLTPNGTGNPGLVILENTTGVTPTITRISTGVYNITLTGKVLDDTKLAINVSSGKASSADTYQTGRFDNNTIRFISLATILDDVIDLDDNTRLWIEIYP